MDIVFTSFFWVTLAQIMVINILLSGDNAVVIALASRSLPPQQQKQAILFGSLGAIVLRIVLTFFAVFLLDMPFLKIVGALLLIWIGIKMLVPDSEEEGPDAHSNLWAAIKTIIIADFVMSLDNVLGVAAAAKGNVVLLVVGLAISIPLIIYGSTLILKLMSRYTFIVTAGAGLLGWVAGEMLIGDPAIKAWIDIQMPWTHAGAPMLGAAAVVVSGMLLSKRADAEAAASEAASAMMDLLGSGPSGPEAAHADVVPAVAAEAVAARSGSAADIGTGTVSLASSVDAEDSPLPPGYHHVSRQWHTLPDGRRDYAAMHGLKSFRSVAPMNGRLRPPPQRGSGGGHWPM